MAEIENDKTRRQQSFLRQVRRMLQLRRVLSVTALLFIAFAAGGFALGAMPATQGVAKVVLLLALPTFVVFLVSLFWSRRLKCPACRRRLIDRIGRFCPECGNRSLEEPDPRDLLPAHPCTACSKKLHWGKGARIQLRYCTHCGLLLDEQGVPGP